MTDLADRVIYEDNHLLVLNKPAGLVVQGASHDDESLVIAAKEYLKQKYNKPGNVFLGVVSRLDRLVTGTLVLARTSKAASRLSAQFRDNRVTKVYWALVAGTPPSRNAELVHYLRKNESRQRMETCESHLKDAVEARMRYQVIHRHGQTTRLELQLLTGRKHQIRVQLAAIGCPILGDKKYGSRHAFAQGIALHAASLTFEHPTKREPLTFAAPVPTYWA